MTGLVGCAKVDSFGYPNEPRPDAGPFDASVPDGGEVQPDAGCPDRGEADFNNNFSPYFGGEVIVDAEVVHFSSFYCIHCARFAEATEYLWESRPDYRDRVRIYFHHVDYVFRHRAAVAAQNQGQENFWALHDFIYKTMLSEDGPTDKPTEKEILTFVEKELKLDMERFNRDLESEETYSFLIWEIENAYEAGVTGTPTAFVCGNQLGSWYHLETAVDDQLE